MIYKRLLLISFSAFYISISSLAGQPAEHVVLISIDGLRPEYYRQVTWPAPVIQQMAQEGVQAETVQSVFPSVTYPAHTTILTGALPARHGIYFNSPFEPDGQTGRWYWEESLIQIPTLWDAVRAKGGITASVTWPVSVGAPIDYNVPEVWSLNRDADPLLAMRKASTPAGLLEEIEREATGRLSGNNFTIDQMTRDDRAGAAAAYLLERYQPQLLTVHLIGNDHFQHEVGREAPLVRQAVATADRAVGQIFEAAERAGILERTAFIVTGDHGMIDIHTSLAPNLWLVEAGLMEDRRDRGDWKAAFHASGSAAFLILKDPNDTETVARVEQILDRLPYRLRKLFQVLSRGDLDRLGAAPNAALALTPRPGVRLTNATRPPLLRPTQGATHGYLPDHPQMATGFIGWGAGFRPGAVANVMGLEDIAPLVATLLDLDFEAPDGVRLEGLLDYRSSSGGNQ